MAEVRLFHPEAVAEARAARAWYAERSPLAAAAFMAELDHAIAQISKAPSRWPQFFEGSRRYVMRRFPFFVVYRESNGGLQILAVSHGRRRPGYWRTR